MPTMGTLSAATGVISMVLLTLVVVLGVGVGRRLRLPGLPRFASLSLHRCSSLLAVAFLAVHILAAVVGPFARIGLAAIAIPFASSFARAWLGAGSLATDVLAALILTSLLRRHLSYRAWRAVHWLAYACWPLALAHSIGTGGGMRSGRLLDVAVACAVAGVAAGGWRLATAIRARIERSVPAPSRPTGLVRAPRARPGPAGLTATSLRVDPVACTGHGLCAELLPELVSLDQWGYPLLADQPVPASLARRARRAVTDCPALALKLAAAAGPRD
jgi:methionine sulfoxide reductase heme-binding subunit